MNASTVRLSRRFAFLLLAGTFVFLAGCSRGPKSSISGKVQIDGSPASGTIVLIDSDGKKNSAPLDATDGSYKFGNLKAGTYKVAIESMMATGGAGAPSLVKEKVETPKIKDAPEMPMGAAGVAPHKDYGDVKTSGLEVEVTGEKNQNHNIDLDPKGPKGGK